MPQNHCPDPKSDVKVRKRKKISPRQEICLLTPQTQKSQWSFSPPNQLKCLSLMGSLKISMLSTNSLKMLKMKSNKGCRMYESLNYRAIFLRAKQNNTPPPPTPPEPSLLKFIVSFLGLVWAVCPMVPAQTVILFLWASEGLKPYPFLLHSVPELLCINNKSKTSLLSSMNRRCFSIAHGHFC